MRVSIDKETPSGFRHMFHGTSFLAMFATWGYSSVAEHSTADREVAGSTPAAPFFKAFSQ